MEVGNQRQRQTDSKTETNCRTNIQIGTKPDRTTHTNRHIQTHRHRHTETQKHRNKDTQKHRQRHRQTDRQTDRQKHKQIDRHTDRHTEHRDTHSLFVVQPLQSAGTRAHRSGTSPRNASDPLGTSSSSAMLSSLLPAETRFLEDMAASRLKSDSENLFVAIVKGATNDQLQCPRTCPIC